MCIQPIPQMKLSVKSQHSFLEQQVSETPCNMQRMTVLILDELDQACKTTEEAVQKIFGLTAAASSRLVVIGIANRLDLAHRVLQPVGSTSGNATTTPAIISFHSYTARQLLQLLQVWIQRLQLTIAAHRTPPVMRRCGHVTSPAPALLLLTVTTFEASLSVSRGAKSCVSRVYLCHRHTATRDTQSQRT